MSPDGRADWSIDSTMCERVISSRVVVVSARTCASVVSRSLRRFLLPAWMALVLSGCVSAGQQALTARDNEQLRRDKERLERSVSERDADLAAVRKQVSDLQGFGPDRWGQLYSPVKLEIVSLSGGADYDGVAGDDGVTVHLRPKDIEGDAVKVPGKIKIQLLDNSNLASPRLLGVYVFHDLEQVRRLWHGKFATQHYTLRCPFSTGVSLPDSRKILVSAEFVDMLSGGTLTASREVEFSTPVR